MDHAIYTAMGAASQTMQQQAVTASNLANTSTPGFRAQLTAMRAVPVAGPSVETRTLVAATTPGADMTPGQLDYTARPLDVAIQQDGWLAVQSANGSEGYTRNGNIQVSATGQLTIQGNPVIGEAGPVSVPEGSQVTIASDGTISALTPGDAPNTVSPVGKLKMVKASASEVTRGDDGLFRLTPLAQATRGQTLQADPTLRLQSGVLEGSNVKAVAAMADMIASARRFEMQMKVISSVDENTQKANQLLSMS
ncbi:MAG: flagellar basal body rod protein FlgF [Kluyvera sp.]